MYEKQILSNGLRLILSQMAEVRSVSVTFFVGAGGCYETAPDAGISHFVEHLCFKGTEKRRSSREISEAIEGTGGVLNGGTDKELTVYWCKVASTHLGLAIDVLSDILKNSRFDESDIENERKVVVEEINMNIDSPQQRVDTLIFELLWPGQPLGRDIAGFKETVQGFHREDFSKFYKSHYLPNNTVISIAGDIDCNKTASILHQYLDDWNTSGVKGPLPSTDTQTKPRIKIEYRDIEQVQLCLGLQGLSLQHPDRFSLDILNILLGEGMSSRLFIELREKHGLAYEVGSSTDHFKDAGDLVVHAGTDPKQAGQALGIILEQLSRIKEDVTEEEVERAKELIKGRLYLALENTRSVANWLGAQEMLTGKILTVDEVTAHVDAVKLDDLKRVARKLIVTDKLNLAVVGPVKNEEALLDILKIP
jgi:predicted Zn-dependent peptidase